MESAARLIVVISCLYIVSSTIIEDLTYDAILDLEKSCYPKDSCNRSRGESRKLDTLQERNCACDHLCAVYGDCCIDATQRHLMNTNSRDWTCKNLLQYGELYLKHTCSATWQGPEMIRTMCETDVDRIDIDPISAMPATNALTGLTYKNYYCAICNSDSADIIVWTPRLESHELLQYNETFKNLTEEYVAKNLIFNESSWGVFLYRDGLRHFYSCYVDPVIPSALESTIRPCRERMISACLPDWHDENVAYKCSAYTGMVYFHEEVYKNVHCALCNGINITQLSCIMVSSREFTYRNFNQRSFSLLLDVNDVNDEGKVGLVDVCQKGEVFDPFFKVCRNVICGFAGFNYVNGRCSLPTLDPTESANESVSLPSTSSPSTTTIFLDGILGSENVSDVSSSGEVPDVVDTEKNLTKIDDFLTPTEATTKTLNETGTTASTDVSVTEDLFGYYEQYFLECPKAIISKEFYVIHDNGSIYIPHYKSWYNPTAYFLNGTDVLVCFNYTVTKPKFSHYMGYITVVGLGISMVCLLLHFITFVIIPELQNLSGKNLVSLALSLFAAYSCFIIGRLDILGPALCTADAILTFYFFQVSFFWMNTMAFDVWRTLKMATTELRVSSGRQWKRFLAYSSYSWLAPLLIVAASVIVENVESVPKEFHPGFGESSCWFKHRRALLVFFACPLIIIMITNICFFVFSARMIIMTTKTSMKHQSTVPRRNFKLYLRLALIMGLTWAVGLVAGYVDLETLWYIFIVLNTLQGLFIFVAFSCTKKVANHLRDKFKGRHVPSTFRSSSLNSGFNSNSTVHTHLGRKVSPKESLDMRSSSVSDKSSKHA